MIPDYGSAEHGTAERVSAATLISRVIGDASALVRQEVALAKSELAAAVTNAKTGAAGLAIASIVMLTGILSLSAALILALAKVMDAWAAAIIVGLAFAVTGFVMFQSARRKIVASTQPLTRTRTSLRQDAAVITRRTS